MLTSAKLLSGYLVVGITSCVFTRELDRKPQQYSTDYLYKLTLVHATTVHCPTLISMPCPHAHYSFTMRLSQGHHAMSMCPDIILFNLHHTPWENYAVNMFPDVTPFLDCSRLMTSCHVTSQSHALLSLVVD